MGEDARTLAAVDNEVVRERVERKLFLRLVLPIAIVTFINAIDRVNVSYAGFAMSGELGMTPNQFGFGVSMFFIAYLIFQYPHALLLRMFGIRPWLFTAMTFWGVAGLWMARVESVNEFYGARFLLGIAEAGFAPGMTYFISRWVPPSARARALAGALAAVPLSMVLGGPLCGWLLGIANPLAWSPWRFMFLVQALPNFVFAVLAAWYFANRPADARWLNADERQWLEASVTGAEGKSPPAASIASLARDPWVWRCALTWLLLMTGSYALVFWLPQLVRQLASDQSELVIGTLGALPQLGLMVGLYLNSRHSDRHGERLWHVGLPAAVAGIAMLVAALIPAGMPVLGLLVITGFGIGAAQGVFWTIPAAVRIGGHQVPVGVIALISMFGTAGGVVGPSLTGQILQRTGSFAPAIAVLALLLVMALFVIVFDRTGRSRA
ncbi:MAG: MFS transporter [Gammaproteobacteria bacterium]|nr:MFS transporter [Gammaproteobacteria bacterium]